MNEKQFNTLVQMIARLSDRIEEVNASLTARIDDLERSTQQGFENQNKRIDMLERFMRREFKKHDKRISDLEHSTQQGFEDQAKIINDLANDYGNAPRAIQS